MSPDDAGRFFFRDPMDLTAPTAPMSATETASSSPQYPTKNPWWWVPSLYLAEGLPYVIVNTLSVIIYKRLGISNTDIALYTGLLYLPWVVKPLWGPLVDLYGMKRRWIVALQLMLGLCLIGTAITFQSPSATVWWWGSLALFTLTAFMSATHDIAADGFYMLGLNQTNQAAYVGIRSTFYRVAIIIGQGILVMYAGLLEGRTGPPVSSLSASAVVNGAPGAAPAAIAEGFVKVQPATVSLSPGTTTSVSLSLVENNPTTVTVTFVRNPSQWYQYFFNVGDEFLITAAGTGGLEKAVFGPNSLGKPVIVTLKADAKIRSSVVANFTLAAGNIPLSWGIIIGSVGIGYLLLALYHFVAIPRSALDVPSGTKVPFFQAAFWLAVAVVIPFAVLFAAGFTIHNFAYNAVKTYNGSLLSSGSPLDANAWGKMLKPFAEAAIGNKLADKLNDPLKFMVMGFIAVGTFGLFRLTALRRLMGGLFHQAAVNSGIPFDEVFITFFQKKAIYRVLALLLLYRLGDAMISKMGVPFLSEERSKGGLGLSTAEIGLIYGTFGTLGLIMGGILGGLVLARGGLKRWLIPMALISNVPHLLYVYLAYAQPESHTPVLLCVVGELFFYGFGFAAYMLYMLHVAGEGERKTSHFALATGFMALSMMLPGMLSGLLADLLGFELFFVAVSILSIPGIIVVFFVPVEDEKQRSGGAAVH